MTKVAIICDPHIMERNPRCRKDNYLEAVIKKLDFVAKHSDKVIVAGDLFHIYSNSTFLFNKVYSLFSKHLNKFIVIPGNHDIFHNNYAFLDKTSVGSLYYTNVYYPDVSPENTDYYVITTIEDRFDLLAYQFYGDVTLWWVIPIANALPGDSLYPPVGIQLRIPRDAQTTVRNYKSINA